MAKRKDRGVTKAQRKARAAESVSPLGRAHPLALRLRAVELVKQGIAPAKVSRLLGPVEKTIRDWVLLHELGGVEGC